MGANRTEDSSKDEREREREREREKEIKKIVSVELSCKDKAEFLASLPPLLASPSSCLALCLGSRRIARPHRPVDCD